MLYTIPVVPFHALILNLSSYPNFSDIISSNIADDLICSVPDFLNNIKNLLSDTYIKAQGLSSPIGIQEPWLSTSILNTISSSYLLNIIGAQVQEEQVINDIYKNNKEINLLLDKGSNPECAYKRSIKFGSDYIRDYYKDNNSFPSFEDFKNTYRTKYGTGDELVNDKVRLQYIYDYLIKTFNKDIQTKRVYSVGEFIKHITITESDITRVNKNRYLRKITLQDIDIAAGFYFLSLTGLLVQKQLLNKELSVAQNNMVKFFKSLKNQGLIQMGCNNHKANILKEILLDMQWLVCVDDSYSHSHRGRRYLFTDKFPRYMGFFF